MEAIEIESKRPWWFWPDKASGWVLKKLWLLLVWILEHIIWALMKWLGRGAKQTAENLWKSLVNAIAKAIGTTVGYAIGLFLVFAFALLWQANGYSLAATFSLQGLQTLWETVK